MKNSFTYLVIILSILFSVCLVSCEKDDSFINNEKSATPTRDNNIIVKKGEYKDFKDNSQFLEAFKRIKSNLPLSTQSEVIEIDESTIISIKHDDYTSYTFLVRDNNIDDLKSQNVIANYINGNHLNDVLINYSLEKYPLNEIHNSVVFDPDAVYYFPGANECGKITGVTETDTEIIYEYIPVDCSGGEISSTELNYREIKDMFEGTRSGGPSYNPSNGYGVPIRGSYIYIPIHSGNPYYGVGDEHGPMPYNPSTPREIPRLGGGNIITQPIFFTNLEFFEANYLGPLNSDARSWWNDPSNSPERQKIKNFLQENSDENGDYTDEAMELAKEMIDAADDETLISVKPFFKYPDGSNYSTQYENFTNIVQQDIPLLSEETRLVNTIHDLTGVSVADIKEDMQWGKGPEIHIEDLGLDQNGEQYKAKFNPSEPDKIYIDIDLVNDLEQISNIENPTSQEQEQLIMFKSLVTFSVCLHELVHYEDFQFDGSMQDTPNLELGLLFEELFIGGYFEFHPNGNVILIKP